MNLPQLTAEASLYSSVGYWPANGRATVSRSPARQLIYPSQSESTGTGGDGGGGGTGGGDGGSQTSGTGANTTCPPGYTLVDGVCSEVINVHGCPPGFVDQDGHCVPIGGGDDGGTNPIGGGDDGGTNPSGGSQSSGGTGQYSCTAESCAAALEWMKSHYGQPLGYTVSCSSRCIWTNSQGGGPQYECYLQCYNKKGGMAECTIGASGKPYCVLNGPMGFRRSLLPDQRLAHQQSFRPVRPKMRAVP
jgi:hypothetical protein